MGTDPFRVAISGDFLNEQGEDAYGELPVDRLDAASHLVWHYLREQGPRPGDTDYWNQFYRLKMTAEQLDRAVKRLMGGPATGNVFD